MSARLVERGGSGWPTQLEDLAAVPERLWVSGGGDLRLLALRSVAVVGARNCTPYGMAVADRLAQELVAAGWVVISGAAYGIDSAAHRGAVAADGCTVAVVAGGIDRAVAGSARKLLDRISEQGLVVAEQPGEAPALRHSFLHRNRIIAALARATVVVEAAERSGALNTARTAEGLGRMVMAVPGPVTGGMSRGTHTLIRDGRAVLVRDTADVLEIIEAIGAVPLDADNGVFRWEKG